jgi:hypothetical protein
MGSQFFTSWKTTSIEEKRARKVEEGKKKGGG